MEGSAHRLMAVTQPQKIIAKSLFINRKVIHFYPFFQLYFSFQKKFFASSTERHVSSSTGGVSSKWNFQMVGAQLCRLARQSIFYAVRLHQSEVFSKKFHAVKNKNAQWVKSQECSMRWVNLLWAKGVCAHPLPCRVRSCACPLPLRLFLYTILHPSE